MQQQFGNTAGGAPGLPLQQLQQMQQQQALLTQQANQNQHNMLAAQSSMGNMSNISITNVSNVSNQNLSNAINTNNNNNTSMATITNTNTSTNNNLSTGNFNNQQMQNATFVVGPGGMQNSTFPMNTQLAGPNTAANQQQTNQRSLLLNAFQAQQQQQQQQQHHQQQQQQQQRQHQQANQVNGMGINNGMNPAMQNNSMNPNLQNNMMMQAMLMQQMNRHAVNPQINATQMQQTQQIQSLRNQQIQSNPSLNAMKSNAQSNGMQALTPEQQLIQQKNLIDQLERQIAQHQSQTAQNNNCIDNKNNVPLVVPTSTGSGGPVTALPTSNSLQHSKVQGLNSSAIDPSKNPNQARHQIPQIQSQLQGDPLSNTQIQLQNQLQMNVMVQNKIFKSMNMKNDGTSVPGQPQPNQIGSMQNQHPGSTDVDVMPNQNQNNSMNALMINGINSQLALNNLHQSMNNSNPGANNASMNNNTNQIITMGTKERASSSGSGSGIGNEENVNLLENLAPAVLPIKSSSAEIKGLNGNGDINSLHDSSVTWDWQTNSDTPERKRVLFGIMKVIDTVQDDGKQNPEKLSLMAKRLEEFLYRSARGIEEYGNMSTLKKRLQTIARVSGFENLTPTISLGNDNNVSISSMSDTAQRRINMLKQRNFGTTDSFKSQRKDHQVSQQQHQQQQVSQQQVSQQLSQLQGSTQNSGNENDTARKAGIQEILKQDQSKQYHDAIAQLKLNLNRVTGKQPDFSQLKKKFDTAPLGGNDKKKVIRQQQQRLMLLRHASKCSKGSACTVKFCPEMVKLWNHMKSCRDKDCSTEHCLSSRCVLNHYRICKEENRTDSCEVCAPVVKAVQYHDSKNDNFESSSGTDGNDPFFSGDRQINNQSSAANGKEQGQDEKHLSLAELSAEQEKLDQQRHFLQRLQQQQELQLRHHQLSNISSKSEQGQKLQKQQFLLQKCQKQFFEDQRLLQEFISRHKEKDVDSENLKKARMKPMRSPSAHTFEAEDGMHFSNDADDELRAIDPFDFPLNGNAEGQQNGSKHEDFMPILLHRKRSLSDLSNSEGEGNTTSKQQKRDSQFNNPVHNSENIGQDQHDEQKKLSQRSKEEGTTILVTKTVLPLVTSLIDHEFAWVFKDPVDPIELGLPDYFEVIKTPMDLNLIKKQLEVRQYDNFDDVCRDVRLVFENAILYNGEDSDVGDMALRMLDFFKEGYNKLMNPTSDGVDMAQNQVQV